MPMRKALRDAMNDQIHHELYSAYLYLSMAAYFEALNLPGFAHWMRMQAREEVGHAMKFFDHLCDRGERVTLQAIEQPPTDFPSPQEAFAQALHHERQITSLIQNLYQLATHENDPSSLPLLHWFLEEQIEEEKSVEQILEALRRIGDDGTGLVMMDRELARRESE